MEQIIDFLLNNIVLIVIVLGVISKLLGGSGKKSGKQPGRMPDFGGGGTRPDAPDRKPQQEANRKPGTAPRKPTGTTMAAGQQPKPVASEPKPLYADRKPLSSEKAASASFGRPEPSAPPSIPVEPAADLSGGRSAFGAPPAAAEPAVETGGIELPANADELRRAVIWAEILGPPRAKSPHRK